MNPVGKILTGLIALFSIVFMTLVLAVYATHTNWRDKALAMEKERDQQKKENGDLKTKNDEIKKTYDEEKTAWSSAIAAEKTLKETLQQEYADQKKKLEKVDADIVAGLTKLDISQRNQTDLFAEVHGGIDKDGKERKGLLNQLADGGRPAKTCSRGSSPRRTRSSNSRTC